MSGLRKINHGSYDKGRDLAQRSAKATIIDFLLPNAHHFKKKRSTMKYHDIVLSFYEQTKRGEKFTDKQLSYIDGLQEIVWGLMGFESVPLKHDIKKKGLRYG